MTYSHNSANHPLSLDEVRNLATSAFALTKHESRSDRYTYIPTSTVIEGMMREGFQPFSATQSAARDEGKGAYTKHLIRFRHENTLDKVGDTQAEVVLVNSHDGTSAYKLFAGIFRLVCSNGLIVADTTFGSLSVPHKGDIVSKVIDGSFQIIDGSHTALEKSRDWQRLQLTDGEQQAFAEAAHTIRFADAEGNVKTPITPAQLLTPRRYGDQNNDLWTVFNRAQENSIRGGLRGWQRNENGFRTRRVTTRGIKGIDQDVRLNRALWALAERMAELKTAA